MLTPSETVRSFVQAVERRDIDAAMLLLAEGCEYDNVPLGRNIGLDAIRSVLTSFLAAATTVEWRTLREAADGPVVFNERVDRFHFPHGWVELPVTGVWEVHDGLITLWRDYFDANMYLSQMPKRP